MTGARNGYNTPHGFFEFGVLVRYLASNYAFSAFTLPGNARYSNTLEYYIEKYQPDDVIIMTHASKYLSFAEYSPAFIGLEQ